jgi:phage N-6-adenine-methyltransferase
LQAAGKVIQNDREYRERKDRSCGVSIMSHQRNGDYQTPKDEWGTPQWLFDLLDQEFHFILDASANYDNSKVDGWFDEETNALEQDWQDCGVGRVFLNPPYSAGNIDKFMAKAHEESQKGAVVVCLVPCATDTKWWHNYAMKAQEIRFIRGRVRFVGYDAEGKQIKNSPTFSSCVVIFDQKLWQGNPFPWIGKTIEQPKRVTS